MFFSLHRCACGFWAWSPIMIIAIFFSKSQLQVPTVLSKKYCFFYYTFTLLWNFNQKSNKIHIHICTFIWNFKKSATCPLHFGVKFQSNYTCTYALLCEVSSKSAKGTLHFYLKVQPSFAVLSKSTKQYIYIYTNRHLQFQLKVQMALCSFLWNYTYVFAVSMETTYASLHFHLKLHIKLHMYMCTLIEISHQSAKGKLHFSWNFIWKCKCEYVFCWIFDWNFTPKCKGTQRKPIKNHKVLIEKKEKMNNSVQFINLFCNNSQQHSCNNYHQVLE